MGKYRIERSLASGGFGNTYVITNLQFDEQYALKEFFIKGISERDENSTTVSVSNQTNASQFTGQKEKFKKEARRLRKLHNPHIVGVHDLFEENGTAYYVMDYIDGESLSARLKRTKKPLAEQEALGILLQVLDALEEVHNMGIWHLDLKPGNILIDKEGNAKLIDFGASKQLSSSDGNTTTTTAMCYTAGYAPAEQIDQNLERIGAWTDLYALGATLYNLLTNQQPPTISDIQDGDAFDFPSSVSTKTQHLVEWMMTPNRKRRPQSVNAVRDYLNKPYVVSEEIDDTTQFVERKSKNESLQELQETYDDEKQSYKKWLVIAIAVSALLLGIYLLFSPSEKSQSIQIADTVDSVQVEEQIEEIPEQAQNKEDEPKQQKEEKKEPKKKEEKKEEKPKSVTNLSYSSAIGTYSYTGAIDDQGRPHGKGTASLPNGSYTGSFVHGAMSGSGVLRNSNGTFNGTFSNNYFVNGRFTATNGTYFIGSFSGGKPASGTWYDVKGNVIQ
ncbi:MAG: protein kinase [Prevotella sp.]|nr:protein kinase [Prevotella sp.]